MTNILNLGMVVATRSVDELMRTDSEFGIFIQQSLIKYVSGDWGDLCDDDKKT